jgi:hypothetical protein
MAVIGEKLKSTLTGMVYEVKMIKGISVLLEAMDRKSQVLTEEENLSIFYEKIEGNNLSKNLPPLLLP